MSSLQALKDAHKKGIVVGLKAISETQLRQDIDLFLYNDPDAFNLFLLALAKLQDPEMANEKMGFFHIAGIHGLPRDFWDGVPGKPNIDPKKSGMGYCAHGKATFPTWHRPYLAMLEQSLFLMAVEIADSYDEQYKGRYQKAALRFRLPFWDYYRPRGGEVKFPGIINNGLTSYPYDYSCPKVFTTEFIMIKRAPDDKLVPIKNPLYDFSFPSGGLLEKRDWDSLSTDKVAFPRDRTVRYPKHDSKWGDSATTMNLVLNALRMDSNRLVLNMLVDNIYKKYETFSYSGEPPILPKDATAAEKFAAQGSGSLEALHGTYHGLVGGDSVPKANSGQGTPGGHMSRVPVAAFDPIFWMHHCQIDRLFAIWQAIHAGEKGSWFSDPDQAKAPLAPFRKEAGDKTFWNSNQSQLTASFGYNYPEIKSTGKATAETVTNMYKWSIADRNSLDTTKAPKDMEPVDVLKTQFFSFTADQSTATATILSEVAPVDKPALSKRVHLLLEESSPASVHPTKSSVPVRDWYIDDKIQRLAFNGAGTIFYFVSEHPDGSAPGSYTDYLLEPSLAAVTHVFAAPTELCDNCGEQADQARVVTNTNPITSLLLDYVEIGLLPDLEPRNVVPFLQTRLKWKILDINGERADPRRMADTKDFRVGVSSKVSVPSGGEPRYEEYPEVVEQIIGGASSTASGF